MVGRLSFKSSSCRLDISFSFFGRSLAVASLGAAFQLFSPSRLVRMLIWRPAWPTDLDLLRIAIEDKVRLHGVTSRSPLAGTLRPGIS